MSRSPASPPQAPPRRWTARLDPGGWSVRARALWVMAPPLGIALCFGLAALMPEDQVWPHALQAGFLASPRWILALWGPWALLLALRVRALLPAALTLGTVGLALSGAPLREPEGEGLRFVSANVNAFGEDPRPGMLEEDLAALQPDVLVVIERRPEQIPGLVRVADDFDDPMPRPSHATAVFCREQVGCQAEVTPQIGSETMKMPVALVRVADLCLLGIHAPPPAPYDATGIVPYIAELTRHLEDGRMALDWGPCRAGDPALAAGDLNGVPWGSAWRALRARGMDTPLHRHGIFAASWPSGGGWPDAPFFALDHLFVGEVTVSGIRLARLPGADHKAIVYRARSGR